jgi:chemotaxis protein methyltransferase CheR
LNRPPLTDEEYRLFSEWLVEEFGLRFGPERRDILRSRLDLRRVELGFDSFEQLYFHCKFHPERAAERQRLIPHLTNNESYFFRERAQLDLLVGELVPALRERLGSRMPIRVLSVACASGEEPYSIAMLLRERGLASAAAPFDITGADLDPQALERARQACYTEHAFRGVEPVLRGRYFSRTETECWQLGDEVRSSVRWKQVNLVDPGWPRAVGPQHIVFCRNVLIYFDDASVERAAQGLHDVLAPGGYLFLGHAETLSRVPTPLQPERRPGVIVYRRPEVDLA